MVGRENSKRWWGGKTVSDGGPGQRTKELQFSFSEKMGTAVRVAADSGTKVLIFRENGNCSSCYSGLGN